MPTKTKREKASAAPGVREQTFRESHVRALEKQVIEYALQRDELRTFVRRWHGIIVGKPDRYSGALEPWARKFDNEAKALLTK